MLSIDVIIPSYRLQSEYLIPIIQMDAPPETSVRYIIIADNPMGEIPSDLISCIDNKKVILLRNAVNLGASTTRNVGIEHAIAEWILFLDDDITPSKSLLNSYVEAIKANPDSTGFFGEVIFPSPSNNFEKGMILNGVLAFFSLAGKVNSAKWSPTANILFNRSLIGPMRFDNRFPKNGSTEDIEVCLRLFKKTKKELLAVKNAKVYHKWWDNGKRNYTRFIRWGYGIADILHMFPEYTYYTFPNIIECLVFGLPLVLIICFCLHTFLPILCVFVGILIGEFFVEFIHLLKNKGLSKSILVIEVVLFRAAINWSFITKQFKMHKIPAGLCRRFDLFCDGKNIPAQRLWAGIKLLTFILFSVGLYFIIRFY